MMIDDDTDGDMAREGVSRMMRCNEQRRMKKKIDGLDLIDGQLMTSSVRRDKDEDMYRKQ